MGEGGWRDNEDGGRGRIREGEGEGEGSGKREEGSGKREAGRGKREKGERRTGDAEVAGDGAAPRAHHLAVQDLAARVRVSTRVRRHGRKAARE